jgi:branched-subunit amino acid ABC-type transport system permease component
MLGSFYTAIAVGFTLIFGVMRVVNFSHGELFMLGAVFFVLLSATGIPFIPALIITAVIIGGFGMGVERILLRRVRGNLFAGIVITVGLSYILQVAVLETFGTQEMIATSPFPQVIKIWGAFFPADRLAVIVVVALLLSGLWLFLQKTRQGRAIRACIQDNVGAALQGVNLNTSAIIAMGISAALAGVAGVLMAPQLVIDPWLGGRPLWIAFVVVIVGGLGSIGGTVLAGFLLGFLDSVIVTFIDPKSLILVDGLVVLLVLIIRPKGLLGRTVA